MFSCHENIQPYCPRQSSNSTIKNYTRISEEVKYLVTSSLAPLIPSSKETPSDCEVQAERASCRFLTACVCVTAEDFIKFYVVYNTHIRNIATAEWAFQRRNFVSRPLILHIHVAVAQPLLNLVILAITEVCLHSIVTMWNKLKTKSKTRHNINKGHNTNTSKKPGWATKLKIANMDLRETGR